MLKLNNIIIIFLLSIHIKNSIGSLSSIKPMGDSSGGKPGNVDKYTKDSSWKYSVTSRPKARYDWSWCRLHVKDELTKYTGFTDFHPRLDEFSTLRIPYAGYGTLFNPQTSISLEFMVSNDVNSIYKKTYDCQTDPSKSLFPKLPEGVCTGNEKSFSTIQLPFKKVSEMVALNNQNPIQYMVNAFSVIGTVEHGSIVDIQWDGDRNNDICKQCEYCIENQCAVKVSTMKCDGDEYDIKKEFTNEKGCTLKIFLAWKGTDSKNKPCISISKIPSNFSKYSFYPISQMGLGLVNDFLQRVVGNTNNPNTA